MVPASDPADESAPCADSGDSSEPVIAERQALENKRPGKDRTDRSELYRGMKRVDPGLARRYRQLEGQ